MRRLRHRSPTERLQGGDTTRGSRERQFHRTRNLPPGRGGLVHGVPTGWSISPARDRRYDGRRQHRATPDRRVRRPRGPLTILPLLQLRIRCRCWLGRCGRRHGRRVFGWAHTDGGRTHHLRGNPGRTGPGGDTGPIRGHRRLRRRRFADDGRCVGRHRGGGCARLRVIPRSVVLHQGGVPAPDRGKGCLIVRRVCPGGAAVRRAPLAVSDQREEILPPAPFGTSSGGARGGTMAVRDTVEQVIHSGGPSVTSPDLSPRGPYDFFTRLCKAMGNSIQLNVAA
jgi:hypothetical protein